MEQYNLIENYISNSLNTEEKIAFENRLLTDKELANDFAMYKSIENTMTNNLEGDETAFKNNLQTFQKVYFNKNVVSLQNNNKGVVRKMIFAAISIAAILVLVFTLIPFGGSKLSNEQLFAKYATPEKEENITRGGNDANSTLQLAIEFYNAKNYTAAIPVFEKIKDSSVQGKLLLSICYVQINEFTKAHSNFDEIIKGQSIFVDKAIWNKALAFLKIKDLANCKMQLQKLLKSESYKKNAAMILKNL